jgi:hypothetical protein
MTKKIIAIVVALLFGSLVIILFKLNLLFPCPNFPSIQLRILSSSLACFLISLLIFLAGLPKGTPLILIAFS